MSMHHNPPSSIMASDDPLHPEIPPLPSPPFVPPPSDLQPAATPSTTLPPSEPSSALFPVSAATAELLARMSDTGSGWDQARSHVLSTIVTSDNLPPLPPPRSAGRGRGRPRGGTRRRGVSSGAAATPTTPGTPGVEQAPTNGPNGAPLPMPVALGKRPRGRPKGSVTRKKRKVEESDDEIDADDLESDAQPEYDSDGANGYGTTDGSFAQTPANDSDGPAPRRGAVKTKFGRRVLRPSHFVPVMTSPGTARPGRRGGARRVADAALCKKCDRGNSPSNNVVVFCDGCGAAYHQFCHDPPIERDVIDIPEKEWHCLDCTSNGGGPAPFDSFGLIPGLDMSTEEKRRLLESAPAQSVIDIVLHLSSMYPHLALFPKDPADFSLLLPTGNGVHHARPLPDGHETDPPQRYPQPGSGLSSTLPPETADEPWLVDDNLDSFNHVAYDVAPAPMLASAADIAASALAGMMANGSSPLPTVNGHTTGGASPYREE